MGLGFWVWGLRSIRLEVSGCRVGSSLGAAALKEQSAWGFAGGGSLKASG